MAVGEAVLVMVGVAEKAGVGKYVAVGAKGWNGVGVEDELGFEVINK